MKTLTLMPSGFRSLSLTLALAAANSLAPSLVLATDQASQNWSTYESTTREIRQLARVLKANELVKQVDLTLNKYVQEAVTEKHSTSSKQNASGGLGGLFFGISGEVHTANSKAWDVSKMIVQNPADVANFSRQEAAAANELRSSLLKFIDENETRLIRIKELSVMNLAAATALIKNGEQVPREEIVATAQLARQLDFAGQYNVTRCVKTAYAARSSREEHSASGSVKAWLLFLSASLGGDTESKSYWEQVPHSVTECESATNRLVVNPGSTTFVVSLSRLDRLIDTWLEAVDLAYLAAPAKTVFPTWGSPYYAP